MKYTLLLTSMTTILYDYSYTIRVIMVTFNKVKCKYLNV